MNEITPNYDDLIMKDLQKFIKKFNINEENENSMNLSLDFILKKHQNVLIKYNYLTYLINKILQKIQVNYKNELLLKCIYFIFKFKEISDSHENLDNPFIEIFVDKNRSESINLQDIVNCLKDTIKYLDSIIDTKCFDLLSSYLNDYGFSSKLFTKLESILNIFFDQS